MNNIKELDVPYLLKYLKKRPQECHKGDFGRVLVVGGALGYSGAVRLAGEASLRVGAGCVSIATNKIHAVSLNVSCPELMCHGITKTSDINKLLDNTTFIVIGPGLGTNQWGLSLLKAVSKRHDKPILFDADALNLIAQNNIKINSSNCIFTPHPGEAARLLNTSAQVIQNNRLIAIHQLYARLGGVIILKGANTLIQSNMGIVEVCRAGNPGMATAGMGDVLSGTIAGLAAQNIPLSDAAKLGVLVHAMAGDASALEQGERGMMASDLMPYLRRIVSNFYVVK